MVVLGGTLGALRGPGVLRGIQWGLRWVLGTLGGPCGPYGGSWGPKGGTWSLRGVYGALGVSMNALFGSLRP